MTFQPHKLAFARKRRQVTQTELARSINVTPRTIQRYERGQEAPREDVFARIVQQLGFPASFFVDARPIPEIPDHALSFRAYSKLKARLRDNAKAVAQTVVDIEAFLTEHFELPALDVPDLYEHASSPQAAARLLRAEWSLGGGPIDNMVHLLEARGVRVFSLAEEASDVDAFCFSHEASSFVVVNVKKSGERGRFDCGHELAHLVLHRKIDFRQRDVEREADAFSSEFLVPEETLLSQLPAVITLDTVFKLKRFWKVSALAMVRRLKDVGRLSDWVYRSMCIQLTGEGYRSGEPGGIQRETSSLLVDMFRAADGIPVAALAKHLQLQMSDVSPLIFDVPYSRGHLRLVPANAPSQGRVW